MLIATVLLAGRDGHSRRAEAPWLPDRDQLQAAHGHLLRQRERSQRVCRRGRQRRGGVPTHQGLSLSLSLCPSVSLSFSLTHTVWPQAHSKAAVKQAAEDLGLWDTAAFETRSYAQVRPPVSECDPTCT